VQLEQNHPLGAAQMGKVRVHGCSHLARSMATALCFSLYIRAMAQCPWIYFWCFRPEKEQRDYKYKLISVVADSNPKLQRVRPQGKRVRQWGETHRNECCNLAKYCQSSHWSHAHAVPCLIMENRWIHQSKIAEKRDKINSCSEQFWSQTCPSLVFMGVWLECVLIM
jgi:hypothetical protein